MCTQTWEEKLERIPKQDLHSSQGLSRSLQFCLSSREQIEHIYSQVDTEGHNVPVVILLWVYRASHGLYTYRTVVCSFNISCHFYADDI